MHEALHVLSRPELATRMVQPGYHQGAEQVVVGGLHLVVADAVEQCSVDEFRPYQPELALSQAGKHPVVGYRFIVELEERNALLVLFYPSVPSLDEQPNLFGIAAAAYHLDALTFPVHFLHYTYRGTARLVQLLLDKHAAKIALFPHTEAVKVELSAGLPRKISTNVETR